MSITRTTPDDRGKYLITFDEKPYDPEDNLWVDALENDPEYRKMIFRQYEEAGQLAGDHAQERIVYIAKKRRERRS